MRCKFCNSLLRKGGTAPWNYLWCNNNNCSVYINSLNAEYRQRYAINIETKERIPFAIITTTMKLLLWIMVQMSM